MASVRTNDEWIQDLRSDGEAQRRALGDLRCYLVRTLPKCLARHGDAPRNLAEDVAQETLIRTLEQLEQFEGRSRFTTWAATIAARIALTELRRHRWKDVSLDEMSAKGEIPLEAFEPNASRTERDLELRHIVSALHDVTQNELSDRQRVAVTAELRGMAQEEIGRQLGISRNAVYKLTHDARKKLKQGLERAGFTGDDIRGALS